MKHSKKYLKKKLRELDRRISRLAYFIQSCRISEEEWNKLDERRRVVRNLIKYYERD